MTLDVFGKFIFDIDFKVIFILGQIKTTNNDLVCKK
jgi:hypothetical protein